MAKIVDFPGSPDSDRIPGLNSTETELQDLLTANIGKNSSVLSIVDSIPNETAFNAPIVYRTAAILGWLANNNGLRTTNKGFLPKAVVMSLMNKEYADTVREWDRINREADSMDLLFERELAQRAGLIDRQSGGMLVLSELGQSIYHQQMWGTLYSLLLETHLQDPSPVEAFDRMDDNNLTSSTIVFLLHMCRSVGPEGIYADDLAFLLQDLFYDSPPTEIDLLEQIIGLRFFKRFAIRFALLQPGVDTADNIPGLEPRASRHAFSHELPWHLSEMFTAALNWQLPPPQDFPPSPNLSAAMLIDRALNYLETNNPMLHYYAEIDLRKAVQRCPQRAEAYLYLAEFISDPDNLLKLTEVGLQAVEAIAPTTQPHESAWEDPAFRDILRLHNLRATLLIFKNRFEEAEQQYRTILKYLPRNEIGVDVPLFSIAVRTGRLDDARKLLQEYQQSGETFYEWNRLLINYVEGGARQASSYWDSAMQANPHVPNMLRHTRFLEPQHNIFPAGEEEEAEQYLYEMYPTWKTVSNLRSWVMKKGGVTPG